MDINSVTTDYTVDTNGMNQYSSVGSDSFSYDNNGNLTDDGTYLYYYDCENRLIDVNDSYDQPVASFAYDAFGRRVSKTVHDSPDVVTRYCYNGDQVIAEYDGSGNMQRFYIYGPGIDEPVMIYNVTTATIYLYMYDRLGSVAGLLNYTTGALVERYEYDVFGKATVHTSAGNDGEWMTDDDVTSSTSSVGNPYMFTGRRYDSEIDKYYYRARYYDADTGRFLSPDPIGYYDSMNLYSYCWNNPTNWIDPYGLSPIDYILGDDDYVFSEGVDDYFNDVTQSFIGMGEGVLDAGKNFAGGVWNTIRHPIRTAKGIGSAVAHPIKTAKEIGKGVSDKVSELFGDDPRVAGRVIGETTGNAAIAVTVMKATEGAH